MWYDLVTTQKHNPKRRAKMHETDAMDFIELALTGFLSRQFTFQEGEDPMFLPLLHPSSL